MSDLRQMREEVKAINEIILRDGNIPLSEEMKKFVVAENHEYYGLIIRVKFPNNYSARIQNHQYTSGTELLVFDERGVLWKEFSKLSANKLNETLHSINVK